MSSAPLAALASTPCRGGLCRSVMTRPEAPKAAAERKRGADILRVGHLVEHEQKPRASTSSSATGGKGSASSATP